MKPFEDIAGRKGEVRYYDDEGAEWRRVSDGPVYRFFKRWDDQEGFRSVGVLRRLGVKPIDVVHRAYLAHGRGKDKGV